MSSFTKERDAWCREYFAEFPKEYLYPVSKTRGMKDCIHSWFGYGRFGWQDLIDNIMDVVEPLGGGRYMMPSHINIKHYVDDYLGNFITVDIAARLKRYIIYACTDGKLRYKYDPDIEALADLDAEKSREEFWDDLNDRMEGVGYHYVPDECCWRNPETGDEACY